MKKIIFVIALALSPISGFAGASLEDLSDDKVLEGAVAEIQSMKLRELEVAIEFIAACMERLSTERNYHCGKNFTAISIKIDKAPQFTRLSKSIFLAELKSSEANIKGSLESIAVSVTELRRSTVFLKLQDAARERYQKLTK
ncbi:MAG: hypothetical protein ACK5OA_01355 [Acidovorax sp.]